MNPQSPALRVHSTHKALLKTDLCSQYIHGVKNKARHHIPQSNKHGVLIQNDDIILASMS